MTSLLDPARTERRRALVMDAMKGRPRPLHQWSAIVHDSGGEITVQVGTRAQLLEVLARVAPAMPPDAAEAVAAVIDNIQRHPRAFPVFAQDPIALEFVLDLAAPELVDLPEATQEGDR